MAPKLNTGHPILSEQQDDKNRLIPLSKAAELYGFSHNYLATLAGKGRLNAQKPGSEWLTTSADMEEYIKSRKQTGRYRNDIRADKEGS